MVLKFHIPFSSLQPDRRKLLIGKEITDTFECSGMVAVFHYNDLNTQEWIAVRLNLAREDLKVRVIPSKISTRALEHTKYKNIGVLFHGCTAIAYGDDSKVVGYPVCL